jgi:hypothetical protein
MSKLIEILTTQQTGDQEEITCKEAALAVLNVTSKGSKEQIARVVSLNGIKALSGLLKHPDAGIVNVALEGLRNILLSGCLQQQEGSNSELINNVDLIVNDDNLKRLGECNGLKHIETLETNSSTKINTNFIQLIKTFIEKNYVTL